jgi:cytochrome d ubiquinol oxidase subunit I
VTGATGIPVGYGTLIVVYAALAILVGWLLHRLSRVPLEAERRVLEGHDRAG